jgi:hypothetical protein
VPQGLSRVRQVAGQRKKEKFTALLHHVTLDLLRDAFLALKRRAAPGVDSVTWQDYEAGLEGNLQDLHGRVQHSTYRAMRRASGQQSPNCALDPFSLQPIFEVNRSRSAIYL